MQQEGWLVVDRDTDFDTYIVNRNAYYLMVDNLSVVGSIPKFINACFYKDQVGKIQGLETLADFIIQDFLQIAKTLIYADTAIQFILRDDWVMAGLLGTQFLFAFADGFVQLVQISSHKTDTT